MRRAIVRVTLAVSGGALLAGGLAIGPANGAADARKRSDLVVTKSEIVFRGGGHWTVGDSSPRFTWRHRTKNVGTAAAKKSRTSVAFFRDQGTSTEVASLRVPRLRPGDAHAQRGRFTVDFSDWDYGTYRTKVCADWRDQVRESDDANNCQPTGKFYVVPLTLSGPVEGKETWSPVPGFVQALSWRGTLTFDLAHGAPSGDKGMFDYRYYKGTIAIGYAYDDANSGCKGTGSAIYTPSESDWLRLAFGAAPGYRVGSAAFRPGFRFPVTLTCPMSPPTTIQVALSNHLWLHTGPASRPFPDPGLTVLTGTYRVPTPTNLPVTYTWNLTASG